MALESYEKDWVQVQVCSVKAYERFSVVSVCCLCVRSSWALDDRKIKYSVHFVVLKVSRMRATRKIENDVNRHVNHHVNRLKTL